MLNLAYVEFLYVDLTYTYSFFLFVSHMIRSIHLLPLWAFVACYRVNFPFTFTFTFTIYIFLKHRLRAFENRVMKKIVGPKRDEVTGEWRRLQNKELYDLYCSPNIVRVIKQRRIKWAGHVARMGDRRDVYRVLVGKPEGMRRFQRNRRR